jgi:hypothetical protein
MRRVRHDQSLTSFITRIACCEWLEYVRHQRYRTCTCIIGRMNVELSHPRSLMRMNRINGIWSCGLDKNMYSYIARYAQPGVSGYRTCCVSFGRKRDIYCWLYMLVWYSNFYPHLISSIWQHIVRDRRGSRAARVPGMMSSGADSTMSKRGRHERPCDEVSSGRISSSYRLHALPWFNRTRDAPRCFWCLGPVIA